jgi:hypothetical protein
MKKKENAYKVLIDKPQGQRTFEKSKRRMGEKCIQQILPIHQFRIFYLPVSYINPKGLKSTNLQYYLLS